MRVIALPRAQTISQPAGDALPGEVVAPVREMGGTPKQPPGGVALADVPGVAVVRVQGKYRWAVLSQVDPGTAYVFAGSSAPTAAAATEAAKDYLQAVGYAAGEGVDSKSVVGSVHDAPLAELAQRHEYTGLVTDVVMTMAVGQPVHHTANALIIAPDGTAHGTYTYTVPPHRRVLVELRARALACLLARDAP